MVASRYPGSIARNDQLRSAQHTSFRLYKERSVADTKRVFVAFAKEDESARNLLKGQSLNTRCPFEYVDMSVKQPYDTEWKTRTRTRIKGSDGVVALLSSNSENADGQLWEINCAIDEEKPLLGVYISKNDKAKPSAMGSATCIEWSWDGIAAFIDNL